MNRFVEICGVKAIEVPDAMRLMLTEAVRRGTFDLWPESTDNGYQPYALIASMLDHGPPLWWSEEAPIRKRRAAR